MTNLTQQDREQLARKGISEEQLNRQLECFKKGFPYLKLAGAASVVPLAQPASVARAAAAPMAAVPTN